MLLFFLSIKSSPQEKSILIQKNFSPQIKKKSKKATYYYYQTSVTFTRYKDSHLIPKYLETKI